MRYRVTGQPTKAVAENYARDLDRDFAGDRRLPHRSAVAQSLWLEMVVIEPDPPPVNGYSIRPLWHG